MAAPSGDLDVLLVEDSETDAKLIVRELRKGGFAPKWLRVDTLAALRGALKDKPWHLVTCDSNGNFDALKTLAAIDELAPGVPRVLVSGHVSAELAVKAMDAGAADCVSKDDLPRLVAVVNRELGRKQRPAFDERLAVAQENERRKIARSLHDQLGQVLTALGLTLAAAQRETGATQQQKLADAQALVEQATQQIRDFAAELWPTILEDLGLPSALRWLADRQMKWSGIDLRVEAEEIGRLSADLEISCFRIAQEALTNVARHAAASHAIVRLIAEARSLELSVTDDGRGFDPSAATGLGLRSMRERARTVGGTLRITSRPGKGATVRARLPLPQGRKK